MQQRKFKVWVYKHAATIKNFMPSYVIPDDCFHVIKNPQLYRPAMITLLKAPRTRRKKPNES
mgnify:FL=1